MNSIINSPTEIMEKTGWMVFLAGPMKASPRGWRNRLVKTATEMGIDGVTFLSPRFTTMHQPTNQVQWETQGLRMCDVALFWIPNKDPNADLGTRVYTETTKMELAENLARGKKIILGIDTDINGTRHMKFLAKRYGIKKVHSTMEDCLNELKMWIGHPSHKEGQIHHFKDMMFGSEEKLVQNPQYVDTLAMNQTLMEHWNRQVRPGDIVYHEGKFGDESWLPLLNGEVHWK